MGRGTALAILAAVVAALALPAAAAPAPHDPFRRSIGTYLDRVEAGVCPVAPPARTRVCTIAQADRRVETAIGYGRYPHVPGHIVRFRLSVGVAPVGTTALKVRFRALHGQLRAGGPTSRWFALPVRDPGVREFPAHVPFAPGDRIAIDVSVRGDGLSEAAAPLADLADRRWGIAEWTPPVTAKRHPTRIQAGRRLSFNAVFERDDKTPPILGYTYAPRQDFLRTGRVYVHVHANERGILNPESSLITGPVEWGLVSNRPHLNPGGWVWYVCELEPPALRAARRELRAGGHPRVKIRVVAWDRANNRATTRAFYVEPLGG